MYSLLRPFLFAMDAENAHHFTFRQLQRAYCLGLLPAVNPQTAPTKLMGLDLPNPVGLAAGLDKNGEYIDALAALGFGFIEIGTVTPKPQAGNPKPRLFRAPEQLAVVNRMGFNNDGIDRMIANIERSLSPCVLHHRQYFFAQYQKPARPAVRRRTLAPAGQPERAPAAAAGAARPLCAAGGENRPRSGRRAD